MFFHFLTKNGKPIIIFCSLVDHVFYSFFAPCLALRSFSPTYPRKILIGWPESWIIRDFSHTSDIHVLQMCFVDGRLCPMLQTGALKKRVHKHKMRIGNFKFLILSNGSMLWAKNDLFTLWSLGITSIMFWKCWLWKWITKRSAENKNQRGAHFFHGKSIFRAQNDHHPQKMV